MERLRERNNTREQSLPFFQSPYLAPIKEAISPGPSPLSSTNDVNIHRSPAVRRSSNPESFTSSSQYIPPAAEPPPGPSHSAVHVPTTTAIPSAPSSSNFNLPGPDLSRAFEIEDGEDFNLANNITTISNTKNGLYLGVPKAADSDASFGSSFYYNVPGPPPLPPPPFPVPVQMMMMPPPVQRQPPTSAKLEPLRSPTSASAFYAAPVRGAGYYSFGADSPY